MMMMGNFPPERIGSSHRAFISFDLGPHMARTGRATSMLGVGRGARLTVRSHAYRRHLRWRSLQG